MVKLHRSSGSRPAGRLVGRLLKVDYENRTAELHAAAGVMSHVSFSKEMAVRVRNAYGKQVIVTGDADYDKQGRVKVFNLQEVIPVNTEPDFWTTDSLEELARRQGVSPISSLEQFASPEFAEDEAEELLAELRMIRQ